MKEVKDFLFFAEKDFMDLVESLKFMPSRLLDAKMIFAQQACEKYLKALMLKDLGKMDARHNLLGLMKDLQNKHEFLKRFRSEFRELTSSYFEKRYPTEYYEEATESEVLEYFNTVCDVRGYIIMCLLENNGFPPPSITPIEFEKIRGDLNIDMDDTGSIVRDNEIVGHALNGMIHLNICKFLD